MHERGTRGADVMQARMRIIYIESFSEEEESNGLENNCE
jgi:hypothetical protein